MLLCGPAGSGKTGRVTTEYVRAVTERGEDAALLLLPTRLACERARRKLVAQGQLPGLLDPRILTFPDLADLLLHANHEPVAALGGLQQRLLMQQIVRELCDDGSLQTLAPMCGFPGFISNLCGFVEELKRAAIYPAQFSERIRGSEVEDARSRELALVYERYQDRLQALNLYDAAGQFWYARSVLQEGRRRPFEDLRLILVDGFDDFTTTQLQVLKLLAENADLTITLCLERDEEARPELFTRPRRTRERIARIIGEMPPEWLGGEAGGTIAAMGQRLFAEGEVTPLPSAEESVEIIEATGRRMEARQVLGRVKRLLLDGADPERIAIISRDPGGYSRALTEVARELGVPLRLRSSEPAGSRPSVQAVLDIARTPAALLRSRDVMRLLKSNYLDRSLLEDEDLDADEIERVCAEARIIGGRESEDGRGVEHWRGRLGALAARLRRRQAAAESDDEERDWYSGSPEELAAEIALVERVQAALMRLFDAFEPLHRAASMREFVEVLADLIDRFGIRRNLVGGDETAATAANLSALNAFLGSLRELWAAEQQLGIEAEASLAEFHEEIVGIAQSTGFVPPGPSSGVIAIDAGQARELDFDHVFVLGMSERQFPRAAREDALFDDVQRAEMARAGIPLDPRHDSVYEDAFLFYAIAASARRRLTLSHPSVDAEGREALRSWYIDEVARCFADGLTPVSYALSEMVPRLGDAASNRELLQAGVFEAFGLDLLLQSRDLGLARSALTALASDDVRVLGALRGLIGVEDRRSGFDAPDEYDGDLAGSEAALEIARIFGPDTPLSASALGQFGSCPFAFFANRVLKLSALDEPSEDVDAAMIGGIVHRCLSEFFPRWQEVREDRRLAPDDLDPAIEVMDEVVDRAFADELRAGTVTDEVVFELKREDVRRNLRLWLEYEVETLQAEGQTAWRCEQSFGFGRTEPLVIGEGDRRVVLRGQIDRIDLLEGNGGRAFAVYDYKTGSTPALTQVREGQDFQLPVYAMAGQLILEDEDAICADWGFYGVRRPIKLVNRSNPESIAELVEIARGWAQQHASDIRAGRFTPRSPGRCSWCDFKTICRWDEYRFGRKEGGGGGD